MHKELRKVNTKHLEDYNEAKKVLNQQSVNKTVVKTTKPKPINK